MFVLTRGHTPPSLTQAMYVDQCLAQDRLKSAFQAVQNFGLVEEYPNVEAMYRQKTVGKLLGKRLWAVASKVVGNDVALQGMVIKQVSLGASCWASGCGQWPVRWSATTWPCRAW